MDVGFAVPYDTEGRVSLSLSCDNFVLASYCFKVLLRKSGIVSDSVLLNYCNDAANWDL